MPDYPFDPLYINSGKFFFFLQNSFIFNFRSRLKSCQPKRLNRISDKRKTQPTLWKDWNPKPKPRHFPQISLFYSRWNFIRSFRSPFFHNFHSQSVGNFLLHLKKGLFLLTICLGVILFDFKSIILCF